MNSQESEINAPFVASVMSEPMPVRRWGERAARDATGWLLVFALFYSPWDYGGTNGSAIRHLNWILGALFFFWLVSWLLTSARARSVRLYWSLAILGGGVLLLGWEMALNAHSMTDADYSVILPLSAPLTGAPGSFDYSLSVASMWRISALLACVLVVSQLACDEQWLLRIWWAIGLAGGSIALLGLLQKATGAPMILWEPLYPGEAPVTTFFATYYYHGNAGAYLNLVLPAVLGLAFRYVTRPCNPAVRALWVTISLVVAVAVISDTSRMGQFVALVVVFSLFCVFSRKMSLRFRHLEVRKIAIALLVSLVALWAVSQASRLDQSVRRWDTFLAIWRQDARWTVDKEAAAALPKAGLLGFGPGTFSVVFPYLRNHQNEPAQGLWIFLHDDYLQTLLEWGWIGGLLWAGIFFGGPACASYSLLDKERTGRWFPRQRALLPVAIIALIGVALHAAVDFPVQISSIQLYVAIYLGICWGSSEWGDSAQRRF